MNITSENIDNLNMGDYITILSWKSMSYNDMDSNGNVVCISNNVYDYVGDVLEIMAIDLPFIACKSITAPLKIIIDIRQCYLKKFKQDFIEIVLKEFSTENGSVKEGEGD